MRIFSHAEGKRYASLSVALEFENIKELPKIVMYGYNEWKVRAFIPRPLRCFHCNSFSHVASRCTKTLPCCVRCGGKHKFAQCNVAPEDATCRNCGGNHSAAYKGCPKYQWVKDSLKHAVQNNMSYTDVFKANKQDLKDRIQEQARQGEKVTESKNTPAAATKTALYRHLYRGFQIAHLDKHRQPADLN